MFFFSCDICSSFVYSFIPLESLRQFWMQDNHFFSLLEASRWLHIVSACLYKAMEAAEAIQREETVVLQGN